MARYAGTPTYYSLNHKEVYYSAPSVGSSFFDSFLNVLYQVQRHDRLDKIASDFYDGRGDLWWVIAMANGLDLPTDIHAGDIIRVPSDYKTIIAALHSLNGRVIKPE